MRLLTGSFVAAMLAACGSDPAEPGTKQPVGVTPIFQRGIGFPWAGSSVGNGHEFGLDLAVRRTGRSAYIRSTVARPDSGVFGQVSQAVSAAGYRGQRVRFSGYVRADSVAGRGAGLWMRIDAPTRTVGFDNMIGYGRAILGSSNWTNHSIVLDVPSDAVGITMGMLLSGSGVARLDDVQFEIVDTSVPTTGVRETASAPFDSVAVVEYYDRLAHAPEDLDLEGTGIPVNLTIGWLKSAARPFATEQAGSGTADLAELGRIIGGARIAAFGEATHGSREFFRMKHRAFEYLVETLGYTHFLIEATMPEARALDRYITTGQGDPAKLLAGLYFWTWNTQEVLDFIQWMRIYNVRAGTPRIRFFGFDMQYPHQALDSLPAMLGRVSQPAQAQGTEAVRCFDSVRDGARQLRSVAYAALPLSQQETCAAGLAALADTVRAHRAEWSARLGAEDAAWLEQYITLGQQWERMARTTDATQLFIRRDRAMADNVLWIARRDPQARLFAWAHNGHVSRRPNTMGRHLANALGDEYRNVAFTFGNGRFNAVTLLASGAFGQLQVQTISGPDGGATLEGMFNATLEPRLILDTRKVLSGETGTFVLNRRPVLMRSIGSVYSPLNPLTYYERVLLPLDYDGVIWFGNTRESQLLPFN
jgi:erythromycin esterase